eukprot:4876255-Karenia_brevis.AAC.1
MQPSLPLKSIASFSECQQAFQKNKHRQRSRSFAGGLRDELQRGNFNVRAERAMALSARQLET